MRTNQQTRSSTNSEMKLALIFLSVMVAISHQQFQRQRERIWWSPHYYPSQPSINNYQRVYQDLQDDIQPDYRQFRPTRPIIYSQNDEALEPSNYQDYVDEDEYTDVNSRSKIYQQRRPVFAKEPQEQRLLLNYLSIIQKTATFTFTSSLTITSIQSCIAAAKFKDEAAKKSICRRKRDLMLDDSSQEEIQFAIVPTETQKIIPTALSTLDLIEESPVSADQHITSSKGVSPRDISRSESWMRGLVEPRFLGAYSVVSKTITTYSFSSITITKTLAIAADMGVLCLPYGWLVC